VRIRHPWVMKALVSTAAVGLRGLLRTLRYSFYAQGANVEPSQPGGTGRYIYALWHEYLLLPMFRYARPDFHVLISQHADGQLVADVCRRLGFSVVRGSSTRGGAAAVRELLRAGRMAQLILIPDGPRGPRRQIKPGLIYLAARTGLPIVPVGIGYARCWRFRSWDRFALPYPWTRAICVTGEPLVVPPEVEREGLEVYRLKAEQALDAATALAEKWAAERVMPPVAIPGRADAKKAG